MSNRRKKRPSTIREALAAKKVRESHYDIPLVDSDEADAAGSRLADARSLLRATRLTAERHKDDPEIVDAISAAEKEEADAQRAYEACFYQVRFRGLSDPDRNALENEHQPKPVRLGDDASDEDRRKAEAEAEEHSNDDWIYALMEACALNSDMTAAEWREELSSERWTQADALAIKRAVFEANAVEFSQAIPKG